MDSNVATRAVRWSARLALACWLGAGCTSSTGASRDPIQDNGTHAEGLIEPSVCDGYKYCDCGLWVAADDTCPVRSCDMCQEGFVYCGCYGGCLVADIMCDPQPDECGEGVCRGSLRDCGGGIKANPDTACPGGPLIGDGTIEGNPDSNPDGSAEAFQYTATTSGTASVLTLYIDDSNTAVNVVVGLYTDNGGHPGTLLTQGTIQYVYDFPGWHAVEVPPVSIVAGQAYWIAILGPEGGGTPRFRDREEGAYTSESSAESNLSALPATWTTGPIWSTSSASAYAAR
ncbi:hypothetical protein ACMHYB_38820 [Sorangium sp. So ce1128]